MRKQQKQQHQKQQQKKKKKKRRLKYLMYNRRQYVSTSSHRPYMFIICIPSFSSRKSPRQIPVIHASVHSDAKPHPPNKCVHNLIVFRIHSSVVMT